MERQIPNFNVFFNPQQESKKQRNNNERDQLKNQNSSENNLRENQNKKSKPKSKIHSQAYLFNTPSYMVCWSSNSNNNSTRLNNSTANHTSQQIPPLQPLPESQFPTTQHPVLFYKIRDKLTQDMFTNRIGFRVRQYSRVQQDYICYLTQLLMTECTWLKVFIIEPNYLYFEVSMMSSSIESHQQFVNGGDILYNERQQIELENRMFRLIKQISQQIVNPWLDMELAGNKLVSQQFFQEQFIRKFQKQVIQQVKEKYQQKMCVKGSLNNKPNNNKV